MIGFMSRGVTTVRDWDTITKSVLHTPDIPCCAKCGLDHATNTCSAALNKCVNCTKAGKTSTDHTAFDPKCPVLQAEVEKKKKSSEDLNSQRSRWAH